MPIKVGDLRPIPTFPTPLRELPQWLRDAQQPRDVDEFRVVVRWHDTNRVEEFPVEALVAAIQRRDHYLEGLRRAEGHGFVVEHAARHTYTIHQFDMREVGTVTIENTSARRRLAGGAR